MERMIVNMKNEDNLTNDSFTFLLDFVEILFNRNRYKNEEYE